MSFKEHGILHSKLVYNFKRSEAIEKRIIALKSKEVRNKISNSLKTSKKAINARKKLIEKNRSPEGRKHNSEIMKKHILENESLKYVLVNSWKALSS
jgi:CTP-dependent riboflavin kinase